MTALRGKESVKRVGNKRPPLSFPTQVRGSSEQREKKKSVRTIQDRMQIRLMTVSSQRGVGRFRVDVEQDQMLDNN